MTLTDVERRVADRTVARDMRNEDWQKAVAINGLLATGVDEYVEHANALVDRSIETQTAAGQLSYGSLDPKPWDGAYKSQTDPAALGYPVLEFYERTGNDRYLDAARRQYEYLESATRTDDGGIAHHRGEIELWVDSLYMICPFLTRYGSVAGEKAAHDEAIRQIRIQRRYLQDSVTGLFRHEWRETPNTYPESSFWSRGNGWAAVAILLTLEHLPETHPGRDELVETFRTLMAAVAECQDDSGFWHNLLDDDTTPLETSGTLMFAFALDLGRQRGLLQNEQYRNAARTAMNACVGEVDETGDVQRVVGPPGGPDRPFAVTSYGQGWFLLAADRLLDGREDASENGQ